MAESASITSPEPAAGSACKARLKQGGPRAKDCVLVRALGSPCFSLAVRNLLPQSPRPPQQPQKVDQIHRAGNDVGGHHVTRVFTHRPPPGAPPPRARRRSAS